MLPPLATLVEASVALGVVGLLYSTPNSVLSAKQARFIRYPSEISTFAGALSHHTLSSLYRTTNMGTTDMRRVFRGDAILASLHPLVFRMFGFLWSVVQLSGNSVCLQYMQVMTARDSAVLCLSRAATPCPVTARSASSVPPENFTTTGIRTRYA